MPKSHDRMAAVTRTRECNERELNLFQPTGKYVHGNVSTSICMTPNYYLPWAKKQFVDNGGKLVKKYIESFDDLGD